MRTLLLILALIASVPRIGLPEVVDNCLVYNVTAKRMPSGSLHVAMLLGCTLIHSCLHQYIQEDDRAHREITLCVKAGEGL